MTPSPRPSITSRVLDIVFGKHGTPEEQALAEAARPPRSVQMPYDIVSGLSACLVLVTFLWSYGWLPLVDSRLNNAWLLLALGFNVLLRFIWEKEIAARYRRRAKARLAELSGSSAP